MLITFQLHTRHAEKQSLVKAVPGKAVQHASQNDMHFDRALQLWQSAKQNIQGADMELVWEALNDALHEVLLGNVVLALHNLLHHPGQHHLLHNTLLVTGL